MTGKKKKDIDENLQKVNEALEFKLEDLEGIGPVRLKKMNGAGIYTAEDIMTRGEREIQTLLNITYDEAKQIIRAATSELQKDTVFSKMMLTAAEFDEYRDSKIEYMTTGLTDLDEILRGGFETSTITEFFGEYGSGKTQFCMVACIMAQMPKKKCCLDCGNEEVETTCPKCESDRIWKGGGLSEWGKPCRVVYIDTENSFRPKRLAEIVCNRDLVKTKPQTKTEEKQFTNKVPLDEDEARKVKEFNENISYFRPPTSAIQMMIIENLIGIINGDLCKECGKREVNELNEPTHQNHPKAKEGMELESHDFIKDKEARLVIIDSIMSEFRMDFDGRGELSERQRLLSKHIKHLVRTIEAKNSVCLITNQVMHSPSIGMGDAVRVIGGNVLGHTSTHRIYLKKPQSVTKDKVTAILIDSPDNAKNEVPFDLGWQGIQKSST